MELPLFPLKTVLFPGIPLTLNIFEPRYLQMVKECVLYKEPFGVVLIQRGHEAGDARPDIFEIGCTAEIVHVEPNEDGHLQILAIGRERFRVEMVDSTQRPYLLGEVTINPMSLSTEPVLTQGGRVLRPWVVRYLELITRLTGVPLNTENLPDEPLKLAYSAAAFLRIPSQQKQNLLECDQAGELFTDLKTIYQQEIALLKAEISQPNVPTQGTFSLN